MSNIKNNKCVLHALPGFMGLPEDWDFLRTYLSDHQLIAHDLWDKEYAGLNQWAGEFNQKRSSFATASPDHFLLGYSLGGRLALHALVQRPDLWKAAIIVSAHPGLLSLEDRRVRLQEDTLWSQRFANDPWEKLMTDWNRRAVFTQGKKHPLVREEGKYDRKILAHALKVWSLGNQEDFRNSIQNLPMPILWIVGENDSSYVKLAKSLFFSHALSQVWIVENAAHRVPWEQQNLFQDKMRQLQNSCTQ